jgi:hypothetical protein
VNDPNDMFRQAVVVIHGIGNQRPMDTMRGFVAGVLGTDYKYFGKPDRISDSLELYRLAAHPQKGIPQTDFYELYWAHLIEGTTWEHLAAWMRVLLWRPRNDVPPRLLPYWNAVWAFVAVASTIVIALAVMGAWWALGVVGVVVTWTLRAVRGVGLHYVGDAARYLSPTPPNIAARHAIRTAALELLRGLHSNPHHPTQHYDRIVVVGHSLGSVIAYDALRYLWQEVHSYPGAMPPDGTGSWHTGLRSPGALQQPALLRMRELIQSGSAEMSNEFVPLQRELWHEQRSLGIRWKITDLVTLGSPLTHAEFLMADGLKDLQRRQDEREYPTCPPDKEDERDSKTGDASHRDLLTKPVTIEHWEGNVEILHHAALFACTRWTNLYYPDDLIGGPVASQFGRQIIDHPLTGASGPQSHVRYWHDTGKEALDRLYTALALDQPASAPTVL